MIIGADPAATTGLAALVEGRIVAATSIAFQGEAFGWDQRATAHGWVDELVERFARAPAVVGVECNDFTRQEDERGRNQGLVAWRQGWMACTIASAIPCDRPPMLIQGRAWRATMLRELGKPKPSARRVTAAKGPPPPVAVDRDDRDGFVVTWRECGHTWTAPSLDALFRKPIDCPVCTRATSTGDDIAAAWKAIAVDGALERWGEAFADLVSRARKRAKPTTPTHRLVGVSDACEAAWIAWHVHATHPELMG